MIGMIIDDAVRLVYEVKEVSGRENWNKTLNTLNGHFHSPQWRIDKARELIKRNVRAAKQVLLKSADTPALELATDALLIEACAGFMKAKRECRHPRAQRQVDEYFCPDCGKRWDANDTEFMDTNWE